MLLSFLSDILAWTPVIQQILIERYNATVNHIDQSMDLSITSTPVHTYQYIFGNGRVIDSLSYYEESFALSTHVDNDGELIVSVQVFLDEERALNSPSEYDKIRRVVSSLLSSFCDLSEEEADIVISKIFNVSGNLIEDVRFYRHGFLFETGYMGNNSPTLSGYAVTITVVDQETFNDGFFWTPYTSDEYMLNAGNYAMEKCDYDSAILYFEQIGEYYELERAENAKREHLLNPNQSNSEVPVQSVDGSDSTVLDMEFEVIGERLSELKQKHIYLGGYFMPIERESAISFSYPEFEKSLTGKENYYTFSGIGVIVERDGVIVAHSRGLYETPQNYNVYQLLISLGGSFSTLIDYEPEIIRTSDGTKCALVWKANNGIFTIGAVILPGRDDWKLYRPRTYIVVLEN